MKRSLVPMTLLLALAASLWTVDAWARVGGGVSSGSRGSRSYSAPLRPTPSPGSPSRPATPPSSFQQPAPQRPGWMGGIGGFLLGGLIGSLLFGAAGHGLFGGIGLIEIVIIGVLALLLISAIRRRQESMLAAPSGYASPGGYPSSQEAWRPEPLASTNQAVEAPAGGSDLDRGLGHIRQMDASFDAARFADTASDAFFRIQAAWMARDMDNVSDLLTPEMHEILDKDCARLRAERRVNHLENIAVRSVSVTEAWQEAGQDFVTVGFLASLLDYTTDDGGSQVVEGSRTEPVKFEEYWTFTRPVGPNPWRLSAIQQPR